VVPVPQVHELVGEGDPAHGLGEPLVEDDHDAVTEPGAHPADLVREDRSDDLDVI
jgi:hypothetical protein